MRRLPLSDLAEGTRALPERAAHYLRVLRVREGETIEVFDPSSGRVATARLRGPALEIDPPRVEAPVPPLVLVQGYPKGDKLGHIVRDATELGATLIVPAICERSVARPDVSKGSSRAERLATIAAEAARQCGRARAPEILPPVSLDEALAIARDHAEHRFVLWERATEPLSPVRGGAAFVVGPEGGLSEAEVARAITQGFSARSLGPTILRTETAATAVLGWFAIATQGAR